MNYANKIGNRVSKLRILVGISQNKLALKVHVTAPAISQIESGKRIPSTHILKQLSRVLRVSVDYLICNSKDNKLEDIIQNNKVMELFLNFSKLNKRDKIAVENQIKFLTTET